MSRYESARSGGQFTWRMTVDGIDWMRTFDLTVLVPESRRFPSLDSVVASHMPVVCARPAGWHCTSLRVDTAYVTQGRVVLRMRDSATVLRMFGDRPRAVRLTVELPGLAGRNSDEMVPVTYTPPDVPEPNADLIAEIQRTKATYGGPKHRVRQTVVGARLRNDTLALTLGDTATLELRETRCAGESTSSPDGRYPRTSSWSRA